MAFEIRTGPRGPTPVWNGRQLISSYDPDREVRLWADQKNFKPGSLVFVAGDPLGTAAQVLEDRGIRAVALLPGAAARPWVPPNVRTWAPEDGPLEPYLREIFEFTSPDGVVWEVWPAFERQAPEQALEWGRRFRDLFRTVQGTWLTHRRFGPRFWKNAVRNALGWSRPVRLTPGSRPLVIAASGPSLDDGMGHLTRYRECFDLWALPSSFETLVRRGLAPDAGVATDGGFYAREHLQRLRGTGVPVLAALGSAPDPVLESLPCFFFSQGMPVERTLLGALVPRHTEVPSQGTVAVTALRLALEATSGPVFIAGLDLSFRDLRGHTSPHTVDRRFETVHGRLAPAEGLWAGRLFDQATLESGGVRTSPALVTYAGWFRTQARFSRPVYRIAPSPLVWDSMTGVSWDEASALWARLPGGTPGTWTEVDSWPGAAERKESVAVALVRLAAQIESLGPADPLVVESARTAVPQALAEDFQALRQGNPGTSARTELLTFLKNLREELG